MPIVPGTSASTGTVGSLIDRLFNEFLEPADELWVRTALSADVDSVTTSWPIDLGLLAFEERSMLGDGVLVEVGSEQALVSGLSGSTITVHRGARGTEAVGHTSGDEVRVAPAYTRTAAFNAVAESIVAMSPPLYALGTDRVAVASDGLTPLPDEAMTITEVRSLSNQARLVFGDLGLYPDPNDLDTLVRTCQVYAVPAGDEVWVKYRSRFPMATSEDDALAELGVRDEWQRIVVLGAAAQMIAARPMSTAQQEHVASLLRTEGYPVESPNRVRDALLRFQQHLINQASALLTAEDPPYVRLV